MTQDTKKDEIESAKRAGEQQHTGNHDRPEKQRGGSNRFGGTRKGAENVEPKR